MDEPRSANESRIERAPPAAVSEESPLTRTYSVPQRFGIATSLLATTLFAVLFGIMRALTAPAWFIGMTAGFLAAVAVAQMICQRAPRMASVGVGIVFMLGIVNTTLLRFPGSPSPEEFFLTNLSGLLVGTFIGYVAGNLIASVFLIADYMVRLIRLQEPNERRR